MYELNQFHLQTPFTVTYVPCYKPTFSPYIKKDINKHFYLHGFRVKEIAYWTEESFEVAPSAPKEKKESKASDVMVTVWMYDCGCNTQLTHARILLPGW